ncbi:nSTAND1 domain-containing NTPase [Nostoc sp.]|uniref:nSTAND1 domain-containing NTPase n=1 Tax=Nostoc sp. TaxID=1180 RepID=UPI002FFB3E4B
MSQSIPDRQSQEQDNLVKDTNVGRDLTFAPVQNIIETQIIQSSLEVVTQRKLNKNSPYQGLKRFNFKDRDRFFGRDKLITRLFEAANRSSLSLVLGASGSGKSSVVRAGLIPELKKSLESQTFYDFIFTPNQDPFDSLYRCLLSEEKDYSFSKAEAEIALVAKADTLTQAISTLKKEEERWLIFVDQFEELFTICDDPDKRKNFIEGLVQVAKCGNSSVKILLAMRSDFLEQFSYYPDLGVITNQNNIHLVTEMYPDELLQAIEQPAARHGVVFEEGLVKQIIEEVKGQKGYLPLLQYTLDLLWESECQTLDADDRPNIEDRTLNKKSYAALEGVRGALQKHINEIYQNLNQDEQEAAKQIFVKLVNIVDSDSGSKTVSRRAYRDEFVSESDEQIATKQILEKTLNRFIDEKLLVSSSDYLSPEKLLITNINTQKKSATIEIAHEILLSSWDSLKRWIEEEKEAIIFKNWLTGETRRWQKIRSEDESQAQDELLKGSRLAQIVELRAKNAFKNVGGLRLEENQFIDASVEWRDCLLKQEKERRKLQIMVTYITSLVFAGFAIFAGYQWKEADKGQIQALTTSSKANFVANRHSFDTLIDGLRAGRQLKQSIWYKNDHELQTQVMEVLGSAVYGVRESDRLEGHQGFVMQARFSPDGKTIATASYDTTAKLWNSDGKEILTLKQHTKSVTDVSFSPNGQIIATASRDRTAKLWNRQGKLLANLKGHKDDVWSVSFSPNGQTIATASADKTVKLWSLDGRLLKTLEGHTEAVNKVTFSRDGKIATASDDKTVKLWDAQGNLINTLKGHKNAVLSVNFSPDGQTLASASNDKTVILWDVKKSKQATSPLIHTDKVRDVIFSPDGQTIATASEDKTVKLWRSGDYKLLETLNGHQGAVTSLSFNRQGNILASSSYDKTVKFWRVNDWLTTLNGHSAAIYSVDISPKGDMIATASGDKTVKLWNLQGKQLNTLKGHTLAIASVNFSPDGKLIVSGGNDRTVRRWNLQGQELKPPFTEHTRSITSVALSLNNNTIASANLEGTVKLWSRKGELLNTLKGNLTKTSSVSFSPNGKIIAAASRDTGTVQLWNSNGNPLRSWKAHNASIYNIRFSPNGQVIATASEDNTVKLWNLDGVYLNYLKGHTAAIWGLDFSPDGRMIATASDDKTVKIWSNKGVLIMTFLGHNDIANSLKFSPDSKMLATASSDTTTMLWNIENLSLDTFMARGCNWLSDYFKNNRNAPKDICDEIKR